MKQIGIILTALFISLQLFVIPASSVHAQSKPEFILNASAGKITPKSSFYFVDSWLDSVKLLFKFSQSAKLEARLNIADEKIVEMKQALEAGDLTQVTAAVASYKKQTIDIE